MRILILILFTAFICTIISCEKFLDEKTLKSSTVPSTLEDMQALLDAGNRINLGNYPALLETGTDDYFITEEAYANLSSFQRDIYTFGNPDLYPSTSDMTIWRNPYYVIAIANTVLDGLSSITEDSGLDERQIAGQALFHRGFGHFLLAQVYCPPYDSKSDNSGLGIPLRLTSDNNVKSTRSTIKETYDIVITDLKQAAELLDDLPQVLTRPSRISALAALSRVYLCMEDYEEAQRCARSALSIKDDLLDLNQMDIAQNFPFEMMNEETIFFSYSAGLSMMNPSRSSYMHQELYELYNEHDLRKQAYFKKESNGHYTFKGSYLGRGSSSFFNGLTTSEVVLNLAESSVRTGNLLEAKSELNKLLIRRIDSEFFEPISIEDAEHLLRVILEERRKELVRRGIRWSDLRRLNKDDRFMKSIVRRLILEGGERVFVLEPNSENYIYKIPQEVIQITGMEQN